MFKIINVRYLSDIGAHESCRVIVPTSNKTPTLYEILV